MGRVNIVREVAKDGKSPLHEGAEPLRYNIASATSRGNPQFFLPAS